MSAPTIGHAHTLLGLSPWLIPLIAGAAKAAFGKARETARGALRFGRATRRGGGAAARTPERRASNAVVMHERLRARVEATIWPD
jgi:hypothetical protein